MGGNADCVGYVDCGHEDVPLDEASTASMVDDNTGECIAGRADDTVAVGSSCKKDAAVAGPTGRSAAVDRAQTDIAGRSLDWVISSGECAGSSPAPAAASPACPECPVRPGAAASSDSLAFPADGDYVGSTLTAARTPAAYSAEWSSQ